jgi:hypothetical protein
MARRKKTLSVAGGVPTAERTGAAFAACHATVNVAARALAAGRHPLSSNGGATCG